MIHQHYKLKIISIKGIGGIKDFFHNLILFYIVFTKLQDAFYRLYKIQNDFLKQKVLMGGTKQIKMANN